MDITIDISAKKQILFRLEIKLKKKPQKIQHVEPV